MKIITFKNIFLGIALILVQQGLAQTNILAKPINTIIDNYVSLKDALIIPDSKQASAAAKVLLTNLTALPASGLNTQQTALVEKLKFDSRHISEVNLVAHQREHFASMSNNLFILLKDIKLNQKTIYRQYCTMKQQYFLSTTADGKDPYMGMANCSKVKQTLPAVK